MGSAAGCALADAWRVVIAHFCSADGRTMSNASHPSSDTLMTTHLANNVRSHASHCNPRPQPVT